MTPFIKSYHHSTGFQEILVHSYTQKLQEQQADMSHMSPQYETTLFPTHTTWEAVVSIFILSVIQASSSSSQQQQKKTVLGSTFLTASSWNKFFFSSSLLLFSLHQFPIFHTIFDNSSPWLTVCSLSASFSSPVIFIFPFFFYFLVFKPRDSPMWDSKFFVENWSTIRIQAVPETQTSSQRCS